MISMTLQIPRQPFTLVEAFVSWSAFAVSVPRLTYIDIESAVGTFWLVGTAAEHHVLYQYQFANTKNIFASQLQTETP